MAKFPEYDTVPVSDFSIDSAGRLHCNEILCTERWCKHLEAVVMSAADSKLIWPESTELESSRTLEVPMFPTSDLFSRVQMGLEENFPIYQVVWDRRVAGNSIQNVVVCYLNRGEGLSVIRTSLLQYMYASDYKKRECTARTHSVKAQVAWERHMNNTLRWAEFWSVFVHSVCITCLNNDPLNDQSDLIPGQERTGVWR